MIIVALQIIKFILLCCLPDCVSFGASVIWIIVEVIIVLGLGISTLET